ncbi:MAG: nitrous oxide reductase family maturation protein NosD [Rhodospirillaceae bacterium]|nr:nitrous oxide reductase family maturation protein NosD [Rhodospirillaceae bacterium]MBT5810027.1 nitrous oxide reductase family maturation protein NosD [Rhodospirillaceae bacterium]
MFAGLASAKEIKVSAGGERLLTSLEQAVAGDILVLGPGRHNGPVVINKSISIHGMDGAVVTGNGKGNTIRVSSPGVSLRNLTITGSGLSLETMDSGIFLDKKAIGARVIGNHLDGNLFGVYVWGAAKSLVQNNRIVGRADLRVNERGNGVSLWNSPGSTIDGNDIRHGRDGIFVNTSKRNRFTNNRFEHVRIAVHYMYANNSLVSGNVSRGNTVGYALMYSKKLTVANNRSINDRNHGLLLNFTNRSEIYGNQIENAVGKCVFIYNSSRNRFVGNRFSGCGIGVHFTAGSEANQITGNAFVANRTQVKYVGTRHLDWSHNGRGNYWSDNAAFDLNGDGVADMAYRPNGFADKVLWAHPRAKLLLNAPSMRVLTIAQARFPTLHPGGVIDSSPLMKAPDMKSNLQKIPEAK